MRPALLALAACLPRCLAGGKVAIHLFGHSFRANSHQWSVEVGAAGLSGQKEAVASHLAFAVQPLVFDGV